MASPFVNAVQAQGGLQSFWLLDEGSGTTVHDLGTLANPGTLNAAGITFDSIDALAGPGVEGGAVGLSYAAASAGGGTIGLTSIGGTAVGSSSAFHFGSIYTAPATGTLVHFNFYGAGNGTAQSFIPVIYSVTSGVPVTLLAQAAAVTIGPSDAPQWYTVPISLAVTSGTSYLIGALSGTTSLGANLYYNTGTHHFAINAGSTTPDATWTASGSDGTGTFQFSFYCDYSGTGSGTIGNTSIGTGFNAGVTAGHRGGIVVTASQSAPIIDIKFYAKGNGTSSQTFTPVVYSAPGGVPQALLATGAPVTIASGAAAGWNTSLISLNVTAGTQYLIGLLYGATTNGSGLGISTLANANHMATNAGGNSTPDALWGTDATDSNNWSIYADYAIGGTVPTGAASMTFPHKTAYNLSTTSGARWSIHFSIDPTVATGIVNIAQKGTIASNGWQIFADTANTGIGFTINGATVQQNTIAGFANAAFYTLTWDGTSLILYQGTTVLHTWTATIITKTVSDTGIMTVGGLGGTGVYGGLVISKLAVYNTALSSTVIGTINTGLGTVAASGFTYSGAGWTTPSDGAAFGGSEHESHTPGDYATFYFNGAQATILGTSGPDRGIATVSTDGGATSSVDLYSPVATEGAIVAQASSLSTNVPHFMVAKVSGSKNSSSSGFVLGIDEGTLTIVAPPGGGGSTGAGLEFTPIGGGNMPSGQIPTPTIVLSPGASLANVGAAGDIIGLNPGSYNAQSISPKNNQTYVGLAPGVILEGNFAAAAAFNGGANNVKIYNLTIQHYTCGVPAGYHLSSGATAVSAININPGAAYGASPPHPATPDSGWIINYCTLQYNRTEGAKLTDNCQMLNSRILYNGVAGYVTSSANCIIRNCESAYNNTPASFIVTSNTASDQGNHSGGGKVTGGPGCQCIHLWVHHNGGNGIWDDAYVGIQVVSCLTEWNTRNGLMHEIGYDGTLTDNLIQNNGQSFTDTSGAHNQGLNGSGAGEAFDQGAGIYWSDSKGGFFGQANGTLIARNTLINNLNHIVLVQDNRSPFLGNVVVGGSAPNANIIQAGAGSVQGHTGWEHFAGPSPLPLTFDYNQYTATGGGARVWMWNGSNALSFSGFQSQSQEAHGTSV